MPETQAALKRLRDDIEAIRAPRERLDPIGERHLRWQGIENPNGWRYLKDLADDLEIVLGPEI